jgi:hypothetical protein
MEGTIARALEIVAQQVCREGASSGDNRVPPLVFSRLARGGKSTFLRLLFDALNRDGRYAPIIVTFNGYFVRRHGESACNAFLRLIASQLLTLPNGFDPLNIVCDANYLFDYISANSSGKAVVLLIDELNALGTPLDVEFSALLKGRFLDSVRRYLVFSTHVPLELDIMSNTNIPPSPRGFLSVPLPISFDLYELQNMSSECHALTPVEVAIYGGIPSLIYSVKSLLEMSPLQRFNSQQIQIMDEEYDKVIASFVTEIFSGVRRFPMVRRFDMFSSTPEFGKVQWPLCYIACICGLFSKYNVFRELNTLFQQLYAYASRTESGLDWEVIVQLALSLRMIQAQFTGTEGAFNLLPADSKPFVVLFSLSPQCTTVDQAWREMQEEATRYQGSLVLVVTPSYSKFPDFDGFIFCRIGDQILVYGYQVKLGRCYPKHDIPRWMRRGLLIRGKASVSVVKRGWVYLNEESIKGMLGYSLQFVYPKDWPAIPVYDQYD